MGNLPGILAAALVALSATWLARYVPLAGAPVLAIVLGIVLRLALPLPPVLRPGFAYSAKTLLQAAIILSGFGLSLAAVVHTGWETLPVTIGTIAIALVGAPVVGRLLKIDTTLEHLIGVGTAICGASAIAAVASVIEPLEADLALSIAVIFFYNVVAVLTFPAIGHALALTQSQFGVWAGTAINDTSSVVAAGYAFGNEAGEHATIVKLTRATFILPVVAIVAVAHARAVRARGVAVPWRRVVPWFIIWFGAAAGVNSTGIIPAAWHPWITLCAVGGGRSRVAPVAARNRVVIAAAAKPRVMATSTSSAAIARPPVTRELAAAIVAFDLGRLPDAVVHEAKRSLFNVLAVAIGASMHPGVDAILRVARETGGTPIAPVIGRATLTNAHFAALANGFAAHVDDYDDTHLATVIHPAAAIAATLLALAPATQPSGAAALRAFVLGCEIQLRIGVAISPEHYDNGWHITGTCGTIGAAVTAAALLGLDAHATARAIGIAASSTVGQREAFGFMTKAYHAGKAAAAGLRAAALAARGLTAPDDALEAPGGFADALATTHRIALLDCDLTANFELANNTYKPYPCGIVAHPAIDAAVALASRIGSAAAIESVVVGCNALVPELMGNGTPADGLQARFSCVHGVTMGLLDGTVGLAQYADAMVVRDDVAALRARVTLEPDAAMPRASARVSVRFTDGTCIEEFVEHARGSLARPLTDAELGAKALALVEPVLPGRIGALRTAISELIKAPDTTALIAAVTA
jgi:uncharacterized integral membrane protein (TIGR00698 family)